MKQSPKTQDCHPHDDYTSDSIPRVCGFSFPSYSLCLIPTNFHSIIPKITIFLQVVTYKF